MNSAYADNFTGQQRWIFERADNWAGSLIGSNIVFTIRVRPTRLPPTPSAHLAARDAGPAAWARHCMPRPAGAPPPLTRHCHYPHRCACLLPACICLHL